MNKKCLPVSLLIPTMDRPISLHSTLSAFFALDYIPAELVVVDQSRNSSNASKNKEIVRSFSNLCDTKYCFQQTASLTKARNNAINLSSNNIVVCSDDDVEPANEVFLNVYLLMKDDSIALVGATDLNSKKSNSLLGYISGTKNLFKRKKGYVTKSVLGRYPNAIKGTTETEWAMGYFFSIKKDFVYDWNVFWDEKLTGYAYAEDLDFSYRYFGKSKQFKKKCILCESVYVRHNVSQENRISSDSQLSRYIANRLYLFYKFNFNKFFLSSLNWTNFCMLLLYFFKKNNHQGLKKAMKKAKVFKKEIIKGDFHNVY